MTDSTPRIRFAADRTSIQPGECVTFRWRVEGVKEVFFFVEGEGWQSHGVVGVGEQQICPGQTTTYRLRVVQLDESVEVRKITIQVQAHADAGPGQAFSADRDAIRPGECVTFRWQVEGIKEVYFFAEGEGWQGHGVVGVGQQQVCPAQTTTYRLRVVKRDDAVEVFKITIHVQAQPESATVQMFAADRFAIRRGECVTFRWRVEGVKAVYFYPEGERWQDRGVVGVGEQQVCPPQTASYCLRVVLRDDRVEIHYLTVEVRG